MKRTSRNRRTRTRTGQQGFTLMEMMVTVAVIGILAAIAVPSFAGQSRKAKGDSEVNAFFAELRIRQEQFMGENGRYLSTGTGETDTWPVTPTAKLQALGTVPATWTQMRIRAPETQVRCGYVVIAGTGALGTPGTLATTSFGFVKPNKNWFYALAHCNLDGNATVDSYYFVSSEGSTIQSLNKGQ
jgi:prepilin-type N-terminal cleavage/methylation domain-containing protein